MVSASPETTAKAMGIKQATLRSLMRRISLPTFSCVESDTNANYWTVTRAAHIDSGVALLAAWVEHHGPTLSDADLKVYIELRQSTVDMHTPHTPELLTAYSKIRKKVDGIALVRDLGGSSEVVRDAVEFVCRLRGEPVRRRDRRRSNSPIALADFLAGRGEVLRGLPCSIEDREFSHVYKRPSDNEVGRANGMTHDDNAVLAGLTLIACPTQLGPSCIKHSLAIVERLDELADGGSLADTEVALQAIRARFVDNPDNASPLTLKRVLDHYNWTKRALDRWWESLPVKARKGFTRFLLPPVPLDVAAAVLDLQAKADPDADADADVGTAESEWDATARQVSEERVAILSRLENRWAATEPMMVALKDELRRARADFAAGAPLQLPITVAHTWPVVRPDGTPGEGRQTVLAEIDSAANLWRRAADLDPTGLIAKDRLSHADRLARWKDRAGSKPPQADGSEHDPEEERRLVMVYHRTMACEPGGECHESWIFPILRASTLFGRDHVPAEDVPAHLEARRRLGLVSSARVPGGMLKSEDSRDVVLGAACRKHLGAELVSPADILRGIAVGRVSVRCELVNGLRIGATAQARDDHGCFTAEKVRGRLVFFMSACMKNDDVDEQRKTVMDPVTVTAFEKIRLLWLEQWNDGVDDLLPSFTYCNADKKDVPSGGFLLSVGDRACTVMELNTLIAVVLGDIVDTTSHPLKYGFAAMVKEAGATPQQLNVACHHDIGSEVSEAYARFGKDLGIEGLLAEAHDVLDQDQHLYRLMELQ
jgi:hypothetical protein